MDCLFEAVQSYLLLRSEAINGPRLKTNKRCFGVVRLLGPTASIDMLIPIVTELAEFHHPM